MPGFPETQVDAIYQYLNKKYPQVSKKPKVTFDPSPSQFGFIEIQILVINEAKLEIVPNSFH
jgi:hypothetical protein